MSEPAKRTSSAHVVFGVVIAMCLLATAASYWFAIGPALRRSGEVARHSELIGEKTEQLRDVSLQLQQTRARLAVSTTQLNAERLVLEEPAQLNRKITTIVHLAERHGLLVSELRPQAAASVGDYTSVPLTFAGFTSYGSLRTFLLELRQAHPDVVTESLVVTRAGADQRPLGVQARLLWHARPSAAAPRTAVAGVAP